jgi:hypothetical protein
MTSSNRIAGRPPARRRRRVTQLMMAIGYCPIWISGLLLSYQALSEMTDATERQTTR